MIISDLQNNCLWICSLIIKMLILERSIAILVLQERVANSVIAWESTTIVEIDYVGRLVLPLNGCIFQKLSVEIIQRLLQGLHYLNIFKVIIYFTQSSFQFSDMSNRFINFLHSILSYSMIHIMSQNYSHHFQTLAFHNIHNIALPHDESGVLLQRCYQLR